MIKKLLLMAAVLAGLTSCASMPDALLSRVISISDAVLEAELAKRGYVIDLDESDFDDFYIKIEQEGK